MSRCDLYGMLLGNKQKIAFTTILSTAASSIESRYCSVITLERVINCVTVAIQTQSASTYKSVTQAAKNMLLVIYSLRILSQRYLLPHALLSPHSTLLM